MDGSDIYEKLELQFFSIKRELNLKCKKSYLLKISILLLYWAQISEMRDNNQLQFVMHLHPDFSGRSLLHDLCSPLFVFWGLGSLRTLEHSTGMKKTQRCI